MYFSLVVKTRQMFWHQALGSDFGGVQYELIFFDVY